MEMQITHLYFCYKCQFKMTVRPVQDGPDDFRNTLFCDNCGEVENEI